MSRRQDRIASRSISQNAVWVDGLYQLHAEHERKHWWFRGRRAIVTALADRLLHSVRDPIVVDVGCGTGANVAALASRYRAVGIDPSERAIRLARDVFPDLEFIVGRPPEDLGTIASTADLFLLMDVLEHVRDDVALLSSILAVAKPGAQVLITVPANESLWSPHDVTLGHYRRYSHERLAVVWNGLPVTVRLMSSFNSRLYPPIKVVRGITRWMGRSAGARGTDQAVPLGPVNRLLESIFAGEARRLVRAVDTGVPAFRRGVSLIAAIRREPQADVEADR